MIEESTVLKLATKVLGPEKPIIVHDAVDGGSYLFLKGLSTETLDMSQNDGQVVLERAAMRVLANLRSITPFLTSSGLIGEKGDCAMLRPNGRNIAAFVVPGGKEAMATLNRLYQYEEIENPFTEMEIKNRDEAKLLRDILKSQDIGQGRGVGG